MAEELPIPLEIPWRLVSTTQRLTDQGPTPSTISLWSFLPQIEELEAELPGLRLVYVKVTVSVGPCHLLPLNDLTRFLREYLRDGLPLWNLQLDLKVTPRPFEAGGFSPYFHAASPTRRAMIETGVVGNDLYEGEADGVSIGKSGSQLHETVSSHVSTTSGGGGLSFGVPGVFSIGGSARTTSTSINSDRQVEQYQESVSREASQERRELLSHMTNVRNILTLLDAKHLGSPYLRFTMRPRPLRPLSVDPTDPNLWYSQLLNRRSSGIEGIQEFVAVVAVPRGEDFCIEVDMLQFYVVDNPPEEPAWGEAIDTSRVSEYLYDRYPVGTPTDELDVDLELSETLVRSSIAGWVVQGLTTFALLLPMAENMAPSGVLVAALLVPKAYKTTSEVFLEMQHDEYEAALLESPLERGVVMAVPQELDTCLRFKSTGGLDVVDSGSRIPSISAVTGVPRRVMELPSRVPRMPFARSSTVTKATIRWNNVEQQFADYVANSTAWRESSRPLDDPQIVELFLDRLESLAPDDPANVSLAQAGVKFDLSEQDLTALKEADVDDLRGLARVLKASTRIARHNARQEELTSRLDERTACMVSAEPLAMPVAQAVARRVRASLGGTLQDLATKSGIGPSTDSGRDSPTRGKGARGSKRRKDR